MSLEEEAFEFLSNVNNVLVLTQLCSEPLLQKREKKKKKKSSHVMQSIRYLEKPLLNKCCRVNKQRLLYFQKAADVHKTEILELHYLQIYRQIALSYIPSFQCPKSGGFSVTDSALIISYQTKCPAVALFWSAHYATHSGFGMLCICIVMGNRIDCIRTM